MCQCTVTVSALRFITLASRTVHHRTPLPIYNHVLLSILPDKIEFTSVVPEMSETRCRISAETEGSGAIAVPAGLMTELINALPPEDTVVLSLSPESDRVLLKWSGGEGKIGGIEADRFPQRFINGTQKEATLTVKTNDLAAAIGRVAVAASKSPLAGGTRAGILLRYNNELELAATDTYRLAIDTLKVKKGGEPPFDVIIPYRMAAEWHRICDEFRENEASIVFDNMRVILTINTPSVEITSMSTALPGKVDYTALVPSEFRTRVQTYTNGLINACRAAMIATAGSNEKTVAVKLTCSGSTISFKAEGETSSFSVNVPADIQGEPMEIVFDSHLLLEGIKTIDTEMTELHMISPSHPCLIRGDEGNFRYILMPMILQ